MWLASVAGNIQFTNREVGLFVCEILFLNLFLLHLLLQLSFGILHKYCVVPVLRKSPSKYWKGEGGKQPQQEKGSIVKVAFFL